MVDHSIIRPLRIIRNLKIHIHGTPCITTFIVLKTNVVDFNCSMLLGKVWLRNAKVTHDWGNNVITIQGNGIVRTILVNRKLGIKTKRPQVLVCYDLLQRLTYEEDLIFETKPKLLSIGTITFLQEMVSPLNVRISKIKSTKESNSKQRMLNQIVIEVVPSTVKSKDICVKPKVSLEDKVYFETYYHHSQDDIQVDEIPLKKQV